MARAEPEPTASDLDEGGVDVRIVHRSPPGAVRADARVVATVTGALDAFSAPAVWARLEAALQARSAELVDEVTFDLRAVSFIDSMGIRLLVTSPRLRTDGRPLAIRVVTGGGLVRRVLAVTGVDRLLEVDPQI